MTVGQGRAKRVVQEAMWKIGQDIGDKEGRMDACIAAAGVLKSHTDCLEYPAKQFREVGTPGRVCLIETDGAAATGDRCERERRVVHCAGGRATDGAVWKRREHCAHREHERVDHEQGRVGPRRPSPRRTDSVKSQDHAWVSYNSSKSAVLQMARSMACELGPRRIRVNTLSPGHIYTACAR